VKERVIIIGPAHPLRGGLATFNQRLATEFIKEGADVPLFHFPCNILPCCFPAKPNTAPKPHRKTTIEPLINSINPLNWIRVGKYLQKKKPDLIVVRYWIPFMGPALGTILRLVKRNRHTKIICIADNIIPHEHRPGDATFTRYFLKTCDGFITMSEKVLADLRKFESKKPAQLVQHPLVRQFWRKDFKRSSP
jgi:hypothetical protein